MDSLISQFREIAPDLNLSEIQKYLQMGRLNLNLALNYYYNAKMKEEQRKNAAAHISEEKCAFSKLFEASKNQKKLEKIYNDLQKEYNKPVQSTIKADNFEIKKKELDLVGNDFSQRKEIRDKEVLEEGQKGERKEFGGKSLENKRLSGSQEFIQNQNNNIGVKSAGKAFVNRKYSNTQEYHPGSDNGYNDNHRFFSENKIFIPIIQSETKLNSVQKSDSKQIKENSIILISQPKSGIETAEILESNLSKKIGELPIKAKKNEVFSHYEKKNDLKIEEVAEESIMSMKSLKEKPENLFKIEQNESNLKRSYYQMITNKESTSFSLGEAIIKGFTLRAGNFSHIRKGKRSFPFYKFIFKAKYPEFFNFRGRIVFKKRKKYTFAI